MSDQFNRRDVLAGAALMLVGCGQHTQAVSSPKEPQRFGVNVYDLFLAALRTGDETATTRRLGRLAELGIPFVRFAASGQNISDWKHLSASSARYWSAMAHVFGTAEKYGIRLVPSVIWEPAALAYYCRESVSEWGNRDSRTRIQARGYYRRMLSEFDSMNCVMAWEYGNEFNTWADWDSLKYWPKADADLNRLPDKSDLITSGILKDTFQEFSSTVRRRSKRSLSTGSDLPQPNAWHRVHGSDQFDTVEQFVDGFLSITPPECDLLSIHLYESKVKGKWTLFQTAEEALNACGHAARASNRKLFVGEWGVPSALGQAGSAQEQKRFFSLLETLQNSPLSYAAIWDYDRTTPDIWYRISEDNPRSYQIEALAALAR